MKKIEIKGTIVSDSQASIYEMFEIAHTNPKAVELPDTNEDILVEINSGGGEVFAGSEIYTKLKTYEGKVTARVVGLAASAASVILMAADEIEISPTAQIMIHNAWSTASGDARVMEKEADVLRSISDSLMSAYEAKTGLGREELRDLMDSETWMSAEEAVERGFADKVMFEQTPSVANMYASAGVVLSDEVIHRVETLIHDKKVHEVTATLDRNQIDEIVNRVVASLQKTELEEQKQPKVNYLNL